MTQDWEWLERLSIASDDSQTPAVANLKGGTKGERESGMLGSWRVTKIPSPRDSVRQARANPDHLRMTDWDWRSIWAGGARAALPFIRSRMKQSLSGVWKAYVIHTMKGQSCREADIGLEQRGLLCSPAQRSYFQLFETLKRISNIPHWSCLKSTH